MNFETFFAVQQMVDELRFTQQGRRPQSVVEFGSRDINGSVRGIFWDAARYCGIDAKAGANVDLVGDLFTTPPPFTPDCVVCCEVAEHLTEADQARLFMRCAEVLPPGGWLVLTCAGAGRMPHTSEGENRMPDDEPYSGVTPAQAYQWVRTAGFARAKVWCPTPRPPHTGVRLLLDNLLDPEQLAALSDLVASQDTYVLAQK